MKEIIIFSALLALFAPSIAMAQEISFGEDAKHVFVELTINEEGDAHVQHKIKASGSPVEVKTISGSVSNIKVFNEDGKDVQHGISGDNSAVVVFKSEEPVLVEYDLKDALTVKDKMWTWDFRYLESTNFIFPESVDLVFVDDRPVFIGEQRGIKCHGCEMMLKYVVEKPITKKEITWENQEFVVGVRSLADIDSFDFDQPSKTISFDVKDPDRFVTVIIPLELLWSPYQVLLEDTQIMDHEYIRNDTHVWLNFKPDSAGTINIVGTTVVPEFPALVIPFVVAIAIFIGLQLKFKTSLHRNRMNKIHTRQS